MTATEEILVLSATAFEQLALREAVAEPVQRNVAEREWVSGKIGAQPVTLVATGIGAVNTAHALTCYLQAQRPQRVVQIGVGGAYPQSGASVGDLALASEENYGDLGVRTPDGWQGGELIGIPVLEKERSYYNCFPIDEQWVQRAADGFARSPHRPLRHRAGMLRAPTNWGWKGGGALGPCAKTWRARRPRTYAPYTTCLSPSCAP